MNVAKERNYFVNEDGLEVRRLAIWVHLTREQDDALTAMAPSDVSFQRFLRSVAEDAIESLVGSPA